MRKLGYFISSGVILIIGVSVVAFTGRRLHHPYISVI